MSTEYECEICGETGSVATVGPVTIDGEKRVLCNTCLASGAYRTH